ncbi:unnamed protein product, partial [Sphacelaria rigidula]
MTPGCLRSGFMPCSVLCGHCILSAECGAFEGKDGAEEAGGLEFRRRAHNILRGIKEALSPIVRVLFITAVVHDVWLIFGNSLYHRATSNPDDNAETFGGITDADDGSALAAGPAFDKWKEASNSSVSVMVDSGASGHYFDDTLIPGLQHNLYNYQELAISRKITAGGHQLAGVGEGLLRGHIKDDEGINRLVQISSLVVPDFGRNLFFHQASDTKWSGIYVRDEKP